MARKRKRSRRRKPMAKGTCKRVSIKGQGSRWLCRTKTGRVKFAKKNLYRR